MLAPHRLLSLGLATVLAAGCGGGGSGDEGRLQVSGRILAATGTLTDSDVNDPNAGYRANDAPASAQRIGTLPATLAGYVNDPGAGTTGRSRAPGDPVDWYRVRLQAGDEVALYIASDGLFNDLDLYLTDLNGFILASSEGTGRIERVVAPASREYLISVETFVGPGDIASGYLLDIGGRATGLGTTSVADFVPGELIVQWATPPERSALTMQTLGLRPLAGGPGRAQLIHVEALAPALVAQAHHGIQRAQRDEHEKAATLRAAKQLARRADVVYAEPNYLRQPLRIPNDPRYGEQWALPLISAPTAWDSGTGVGALVAVIDTGINASHPDLVGQIEGGYDFIRDPANAADGDGIDADPADPNPRGATGHHGTHVAGTVAARGDNTTGIAGVAFGAKIMPLRTMGRDGGTDYDVSQATLYAAGLANDSGRVPARRADVINLSLGGPARSAALEAAIEAARAAGVVVVAAAGNDGASVRTYPAAYPGVIGVGAVDRNQQVASYSNFGDWVDVAAPGGRTDAGESGGILSTAGGSGYSFKQGTSMASPHVAGVIALMRAVAPGLTPGDVDALLSSGRLARDIGPAGRDDSTGHGLIDAARAITAAAEVGGGSPVAILAAHPTALSFGLTDSSAELLLERLGSGSTALLRIEQSSGSTWLGVTATSVDANGLGRYRVDIERSALAPGDHRAEIRFVGDANTVTVPVSVRVLTSAGGDVGVQYLLVEDADSGNVAGSATLSRGADGQYRYQVGGLHAGRYQLFAGSDLDNDGFICDPGESCGAYLDLDAPRVIDLRASRSGLDFVSDYPLGLRTSAGAALPPRGLVRTTDGKRRGSP